MGASHKTTLTPFTLGENIVTVGADGDFQTVAAALEHIGNKTCFLARTDLGSPVATAWINGTSAITLSAAPTSGNYDPNERLWFKCAGDTYYYPVESSSGFATGLGTLYSAINRHEAGDLSGTPAVTFYEEQNYVILILSQWHKETIPQTSLAAAMSVTITSLNGAVLDLASAGGNSTWLNGRIRFHNVMLHHNGGAAVFATPTFSSLILDAIACEISTSQADYYSPSVYMGAVNMAFCRVNSYYNTTRGHMLNFLTKGDQRFQNIVWTVRNNASLAVASQSNAWFVDRFYARNIFFENVKGTLRDPRGDFGIATLIGAGTTTSGIGTASQADYVGISGCTLTLRDSATATMLMNILSVADGEGIYLGATTAGVSGGIVDLYDCAVIAPRGTSTRKLVQALANPTNAITINHFNPLAQTRDAQANITYAALT